jgi:hypothetical protein
MNKKLLAFITIIALIALAFVATEVVHQVATGESLLKTDLPIQIPVGLEDLFR